jgi:hypothetical protein
MEELRIKKRSFRIGILNIKVAPKDEAIDSSIFYKDIFKTIFEENIAVNTRGEKFMDIYEMNYYNNDKIVYGKLMYYTVLDPNDWYNRKAKTREKVTYDLSLYPNAKEGEYFFIPEAHRFCFILTSGGIAVSQVISFLTTAIEKVIDDSQSVTITEEKNEDVIEKILNAKDLSFLDINITYTNNDLTDDFDKLLDDDLKEGHIRNLHLQAKSFKKDSINLTNSKVLKAALKLSQSNGYAEATIKENGKNKTICTTQYPREEIIETSYGNEFIDIYKKIINIFRNVQ